RHEQVALIGVAQHGARTLIRRNDVERVAKLIVGQRRRRPGRALRTWAGKELTFLHRRGATLRNVRIVRRTATRGARRSATAATSTEPATTPAATRTAAGALVAHREPLPGLREHRETVRHAVHD